MAERVRQAVAEPVDFDGQELTTTVSIGIVVCVGGTRRAPAYVRAAKDLLRDADAAMYKAKAAGKDRYVVFDQAMHAEVVERMHLEADLRRAVDRGELELHYQPIVSLDRRRRRSASRPWSGGGAAAGWSARATSSPSPRTPA